MELRRNCFGSCSDESARTVKEVWHEYRDQNTIYLRIEKMVCVVLSHLVRACSPVYPEFDSSGSFFILFCVLHVFHLELLLSRHARSKNGIIPISRFHRQKSCLLHHNRQRNILTYWIQTPHSKRSGDFSRTP